MPPVAFDFTINIPVLLTIAGGFFLFSKWLNSIANALSDIKSMKARLVSLEKTTTEHGQSIAALEALSDGFVREKFRRVARRDD